VKADDRQDSDSPQSVNIWAVSRCIRVRATHRWQGAMRTRNGGRKVISGLQ
jgi:hypothetical protein